MDAVIRILNRLWFSTIGYDDHVEAEVQLAVGNGQRRVRAARLAAEKVIRDLDPRSPLILR